jgi:AcrR family transcriptional regulator
MSAHPLMLVFMARPLSDEKRSAILVAATAAVAALGANAPTARISKEAGVAEGTLFVYFPTKDDLLCELYLDLKADLRRAIATSYPADASVEHRFRHLWDRLIEWGASHPEEREAMRKLSVSDRISEVRQKAESEACNEIQGMIEADLKSGALREQPVEFLVGAMNALADMVFEMAGRGPGTLDRFKQLGWEALWGAISPR